MAARQQVLRGIAFLAHLQLVRAFEPFAALQARERLLPRMNADVLVQITDLHKPETNS